MALALPELCPLIARPLSWLPQRIHNDGLSLMLDHLLVSRALLAHYRGIEVHNEALGDELVAYTLVDAAPDSYHAPVAAEFEIDGT